MSMLPTSGLVLLLCCGLLRAQLVNGGFESGVSGGVPEGWIYVGPLELNAGNPGEHGSLGLRAAPNSQGGGNGVSTTVNGVRWLNGGRDSVFYQMVVAAMVPGTVYRFSVHATKAGSSSVIARISLTSTPLTIATYGSASRLATKGTLVGDQGTPPEWVLNSVLYTAQPADAGLPLYANLESYRDVSTAVAGWDAASFGSVGNTAVAIDSAGARTANTDLVHDGSLGGIGGSSTQSATTAKHGYIGQLYDLMALQLAASPLTVNENGTRQLTAALVMDDATTLAAAGGFTWSIVSGPLAIDTSGLASGQLVYQDTAATARASLNGATGTLELTVLDTLADNFGSYAGDGLDDAWQVGFFGLDNPDAGPHQNPDHDFYPNLIEFLTGSDPVSSADFFRFEIASLNGPSSTLQLSKIIPGTRYRIQRSTDLGRIDPWAEVASFTTASEVSGHQVTVPTSSAVREFYRLTVEPE